MLLNRATNGVPCLPTAYSHLRDSVIVVIPVVLLLIAPSPSVNIDLISTSPNGEIAMSSERGGMLKPNRTCRKLLQLPRSFPRAGAPIVLLRTVWFVYPRIG
jgi:hypothetical protein